jgi:predicted phage baseplate assembly protein
VRLSATPVLVRDRPEAARDAAGRAIRITGLRLEVDEGQGFLPWREVEDFYASGPDDPDFTLNRTTGEVRFGDGRHGRIPVANAAAPVANIVAREYRVGGGESGNAGPNTVTDLQTSITGVQSVTNLTAATGGTDEEPLEETKLRAAREVKAKDRAVTVEDFELLSIGTPGARVRRAKALPLRHPAFGEVSIPGAVTVIVVPDTSDPAPQPNETTLRLVCAHLNRHRLLTSEVHVVPPTYRKVRIEAEVIVQPDGDLAEAKRGVEDALTAYLHPLTGGDEGTGWPFGRDVFFSSVYRVILGVTGVDRVRDGELFIWLDGERQIFCRDVPIGGGALTYTEGHDIRVAYPGSV